MKPFSYRRVAAPHRATARRAFTLIELLVVIAIIAILAAILFPVFGRARENARRSSCQSNMKQIGLGLMQYEQDYDETFPMRYVRGANSTSSYCEKITWRRLLDPYMKSREVTKCISNPRRDSNTAEQDGWPISYAAAFSVSGSLGGVFRDKSTVSPGTGCTQGDLPPAYDKFPSITKTVEIANVSQTLTVVESTTGNAFYYIESPADSNQTELSTGPNYYKGHLFSGHLATGNYLFADGHVKSLKPFQTVLPEAGGVSTYNMWKINGLGFGGTDANNVKANLKFAADLYQ